VPARNATFMGFGFTREADAQFHSQAPQ
jgi:hypothetical protein